MHLPDQPLMEIRQMHLFHNNTWNKNSRSAAFISRDRRIEAVFFPFFSGRHS